MNDSCLHEEVDRQINHVSETVAMPTAHDANVRQSIRD